MSDYLKDYGLFPIYTEKCDRIFRKIKDWVGESRVKNGIARVFILIIPVTFEMSFIWFSPLMKLLIFLLWKLFLFIIRYCWCVILIIISEILEENEVCQNYIVKYKELKKRSNSWANNKFKNGLILFLVLCGPFLFEMIIFYGLKLIISTIIYFLKKTFFYFASIFGFYCLFRLIQR
jgi:hypothetical protein